jgi:hypothetical protein
MENVCITIKELLQQDEVCIQIAKRVRHEIGGNILETYTNQGRITLYDCCRIDVLRSFKSAYDKFDVGFSLTTYYKRKEIYDSQSKTWNACEDGLNFYSYPLIKVVARDVLEKEPTEIIQAMSQVFKSDILFLGQYSNEKVDASQLRKILGQSLITVVYQEEIKL